MNLPEPKVVVPGTPYMLPAEPLPPIYGNEGSLHTDYPSSAQENARRFEQRGPGGVTVNHF